MTRRWACPKCLRGVLAPERMAADDIRRFCQHCSFAPGNKRLVERVCPALEKRRAARASKRLMARAEKWAVRIKDIVRGLGVQVTPEHTGVYVGAERSEHTLSLTFEWLVDNYRRKDFDADVRTRVMSVVFRGRAPLSVARANEAREHLRAVVEEYRNLPAWGGLCKDVKIASLRTKNRRETSGNAAYWNDQLRFTVGLDRASQRMVVLHEMAHIVAGKRTGGRVGHTGPWRTVFVEGARGILGDDWTPELKDSTKNALNGAVQEALREHYGLPAEKNHA